jgi:hypothetical protein
MIHRTLGLLVLCGLMATVSLQAHHSIAGVYNVKKTEKAQGTIVNVKFTNPHGAMSIEVKNPADGTAKVWVLTTGSANVLANLGISANGPNTVKAGDLVDFTYYPAINGSNLGFLRSITLPNKKEVEFEIQ